MAAEEVGEVDVGDGWNEIGGSGEQKEAKQNEEMFDLDNEMDNKAQVVGDKEEEQTPMDLDDDVFDLDAENEKME